MLRICCGRLYVGFVAASCGWMLLICCGRLCVGVLLPRGRVLLNAAELLRLVVSWSAADMLQQVAIGCHRFVAISCNKECC